MEIFVIFIALIYWIFCYSFMYSFFEDEIIEFHAFFKILILILFFVLSPLEVPVLLGVTIAEKLK